MAGDQKIRDVVFRSSADVQTWLDDAGADGIVRLRLAVKEGKITGSNRTIVDRYLSRHDEHQAAVDKREGTDLRRKKVTAAVDQAETAKKTLRTVWIGILATVAALIVAAWPYIKDVGR